MKLHFHISVEGNIKLVLSHVPATMARNGLPRLVLVPMVHVILNRAFSNPKITPLLALVGMDQPLYTTELEGLAGDVAVGEDVVVGEGVAVVEDADEEVTVAIKAAIYLDVK